jgi:hypothetical protein
MERAQHRIKIKVFFSLKIQIDVNVKWFKWTSIKKDFS